jgi:hypothetical protein
VYKPPYDLAKLEKILGFTNLPSTSLASSFSILRLGTSGVNKAMTWQRVMNKPNTDEEKENGNLLITRAPTLPTISNNGI